MKNEKLVWKALKMLHEKAKFWDKHDRPEIAGIYQNAHDMLLYALDGNEECLQGFDTYEKEK